MLDGWLRYGALGNNDSTTLQPVLSRDSRGLGLSAPGPGSHWLGLWSLPKATSKLTPWLSAGLFPCHVGLPPGLPVTRQVEPREAQRVSMKRRTAQPSNPASGMRPPDFCPLLFIGASPGLCTLN